MAFTSVIMLWNLEVLLLNRSLTFIMSWEMSIISQSRTRVLKRQSLLLSALSPYSCYGHILLLHNTAKQLTSWLLQEHPLQIIMLVSFRKGPQGGCEDRTWSVCIVILALSRRLLGIAKGSYGPKLKVKCHHLDFCKCC